MAEAHCQKEINMTQISLNNTIADGFTLCAYYLLYSKCIKLSNSGKEILWAPYVHHYCHIIATGKMNKRSETNLC